MRGKGSDARLYVDQCHCPVILGCVKLLDCTSDDRSHMLQQHQAPARPITAILCTAPAFLHDLTFVQTVLI